MPTINGTSGNDTINIETSSAELFRGSHDSINAGLGDDLITGDLREAYLYGGGGFDTYQLDSGKYGGVQSSLSTPTIINDSNGQGVLVVNGSALNGSVVKTGDFTYQMAVGGDVATFTYSPSPYVYNPFVPSENIPKLMVTMASDPDAKIVIENFFNGHLGINLPGVLIDGRVNGTDSADTIIAGYRDLQGDVLAVTASTVVLAGNGNDIINAANVTDAAGRTFYLNGDAGNDTIRGSAGDDLMDGGVGNDKIFASVGNDVITGGAGKDQFVYDVRLPGVNHTTIVDFVKGQDKIIIDATMTFINNHDSYVNGNEIITFGDGSTLTLIGHDVANRLVASDFIFV